MEWFGIPEATEEYIAGSSGKMFFCAYDGDRPVGFLYLKETGRHTVELAVMGYGRNITGKGLAAGFLMKRGERPSSRGILLFR